MKIEWLTIPRYMEMAGIGRNAVEKMIALGELTTTTTEGGGRTLIKVETMDKEEQILNTLEDLTIMVNKLAKHLGVSNEV